MVKKVRAPSEWPSLIHATSVRELPRVVDGPTSRAATPSGDHSTKVSNRTVVRGGVGLVMLLTDRQARELLSKHGIFAREICDKCGAVLGAVRFTRRDEAGVWCSPECRGDGERKATRKNGRPCKYRNSEECRAARWRGDYVSTIATNVQTCA